MILRTCYEFYKLPEAERKAMVGQPFQEEIPVRGRKGQRRAKLGLKSKPSTTLYFPVDLHPTEFNYGEPQGLIFVTMPTDVPGHPNWFRVGVCSPDDLDKDLDFSTEDTEQAQRWRQQAIEFLSDPTNMRGVLYDDVLTFIQTLLNAGTRTS